MIIFSTSINPEDTKKLEDLGHTVIRVEPGQFVAVDDSLTSHLVLPDAD